MLGSPGATTASPSIPLTPSTELLDQPKFRKAALLGEARHYLEAAALYEEQLDIQPNHPLLLIRLAHVLHLQAQMEPDLAKAQGLNKRARELAKDAERFGATDPLTPMLLSAIREDGSMVEPAKGTFSKQKEVEALIREGETAFSRRDNARAIERYQQAFALEPTNYSAALLTGDAYFADRQFEPACEWFRKAIALSPQTETAHRYLGDALDRMGWKEAAFHEWIAAAICEPYQRVTRQHFTAQMRQAAEAGGHAIPRFPPMRSTVEGTKVNLAVDPEDGALLMAYHLVATGWRTREFAKHYPHEKTPRRSLPEEVTAIEAFLEMASHTETLDATKQAEIKKWKPVVDGLKALKRDGLLEAYIFFERADDGLVKDYAAYRAEHRDQLHRYLWVYWCGFE